MLLGHLMNRLARRMACPPRIVQANCWMHASCMGGPATCASWRPSPSIFWRTEMSQRRCRITFASRQRARQ